MITYDSEKGSQDLLPGSFHQLVNSLNDHGDGTEGVCAVQLRADDRIFFRIDCILFSDWQQLYHNPQSPWYQPPLILAISDDDYKKFSRAVERDNEWHR